MPIIYSAVFWSRVQRICQWMFSSGVFFVGMEDVCPGLVFIYLASVFKGVCSGSVHTVYCDLTVDVLFRCSLFEWRMCVLVLCLFTSRSVHTVFH